jgi:hypothetical protein
LSGLSKRSVEVGCIKRRPDFGYSKIESNFYIFKGTRSLTYPKPFKTKRITKTDARVGLTENMMHDSCRNGKAEKNAECGRRNAEFGGLAAYI